MLTVMLKVVRPLRVVVLHGPSAAGELDAVELLDVAAPLEELLEAPLEELELPCVSQSMEVGTLPDD